MAAHQLVSPPHTPNDPSCLRQKQEKKKGYRRIRFKAWAPAAKDVDEPPPSTTPQASPDCQHDRTQLQQLFNSAILKDPDKVYRCPSPLTSLPKNGTRQDPFIALPIKATGCVPATLDYFLKVVAPEDKTSALGCELDHHMTMLFPFMLNNPPLFQSIIALCRGSILISIGHSPTEDKYVQYHRSKALLAVTDSLNGDTCSSDTTLLTISMLLTLEYLSGNAGAVTAHIAGLNKLIELRDDLDDSTPWRAFVKRGLKAYQTLGSFITGEPPIVPKDSRGFIEEAFVELTLDRPISYPDLPFEPDICTILARLPPGFSELCLSGHISTQAMHVLASLSATTTSCDIGSIDDAKLDSELQVMFSALQKLSLIQTKPMEKYVSCGLVAWSFQLRRLRALNLFHDPPLRTFIKLLPAQEKPDSIREQRCLIWVTIAVAGALKLRSIRMPGSHLVLDRMFTLYPITRCWKPLAAILKTFFWSESIGTHWKLAWEEGIKSWRVRQARESASHLCVTMVQEEEEEGFMEPDEATIDDIAKHTRAAPMTMFENFRATQCPFLKKARQKQDAT